MSLPLLGGGAGHGSGGGASSGTATAFLARTSGLDATHINAYTDLLNGLDSDGITTKLDVLYVCATQDSTTALLNLVSSSYTATAVGAPTFTADRGYTGAVGKYLTTGFTPSTASSPQFVQNSGHVSVWPLNNLSTGSAFVMGATTTANANITGIHARFTGDIAVFYVNSTGNASVANASSIGHFIANRTTSSALQGYKNGSSVLTDNANTSSAVGNREFFVAGQNQAGTPFGAPYQISMASVGSSLSSTDATNFYNRLRTYMTAVGVP